MARIYTRTGDDGTTGLIGGKRVAKDSLYTQACGSLDELNALIGLARSHSLPEDADRVLAQIQDDLFTVGAELAVPGESGRAPQSVIGDDEIRRLETEIDTVEERLEPLRQFILPGGSAAGAELHLARAVARRAERHCVTLSRMETVRPAILRYLNRLSDLCFVLARYVNKQQSVPEQNPTYGRR